MFFHFYTPYFLKHQSQYLPSYPCTGFGIGKGVVVVLKTVTAFGGYGVQLVVGEMAECSSGGAERVVELIVGVVHAIDTKDGFKTAFVKRFVVGYKGQALDKRLYLCPYLREDRGIVRVLLTQAMHLRTPVVVIVGLWLYEGIERIYYLTIAHYDDANRADRTALVVCRLKIYCCKVSHIVVWQRLEIFRGKDSYFS